jgi:hypothetical protein
VSPVAHKPAGRPDGGQFAGVAHTESAITLPASQSWPSTGWQLRRNVVDAVYTAGRGFGRNRFGNPERIQEAWDASAAYVSSLGEPLSAAETEARDAYAELCEAYEADKDGLDDKERRTRQFGAARQASWIIEYRDQAENEAAREHRAREGAS